MVRTKFKQIFKKILNLPLIFQKKKESHELPFIFIFLKKKESHELLVFKKCDKFYNVSQMFFFHY